MRIAIRDTTDSHTVGFFDNKAGIKFKSAEMTQFLKGACSYVSIKYRSKDAEKVRAGCKLAFRHKGKDYWLTINEFSKKGTEVEITAYSLSLEANKEKRSAYKAPKAMSIVEYFPTIDHEGSLEIGINEISDKKLTLEWTGTDTVLARLYSLANYFDAELEFVTELNPDYSLRRHVVNIYRSGNLGGDSTGRPVRVGTDLKVLGFNSNINDLYTAIDVTGKDGLKLPDKTIKDAKGEVQFFSKNGRLYAPQARDKFPSNKVKTQDRYILADAKPTEYTDQEALFSYALSEMKKHCDVQVEYSTEGAVKGSVGDTKTLIDSVNFEPTLYVQARITEQTEDLETGKSLKTTFSNFKRTSSQLSSDLTKKIEELAKSAVPHRIVMITSNGTSFKNGTGQSIVSPKLFKGDTEITDATYRFNFNNNTVAGLNYTVNASAVNGTSVLKIDAYVGNDVVARDELTFINVNDGSKGADGNGIASTAITYQAGTSATVAPTGAWSSSPVSVPAGQFLWTRTIFTYTDTTTKTIYSVAKMGETGPQGPKGTDGQSSYTHVAYANKSTDVLFDAMPTLSKPFFYNGATGTSVKIPGGYRITTTGGSHQIKQYVGFNGTSGKNVYTYVVIKNTHPTNDLVISFNGLGAVLNGGFSNITVKPGQTHVDYRPAVCRDTYDFVQICMLSTAISNDLSYEIYDYALYNTNPFINFSLDVNPNCRFRGEYQDNNQTASTDPTKYKWSDLKGGFDVGGINLLPNSGKFTNLDGWAVYASIDNFTLVDDKIHIVASSTGMPRFRNGKLFPLTSVPQEFTVSVEYISTSLLSMIGKSSDSLTVFNENGAQGIGTITKVKDVILDGNRKRSIFNWQTLTATATCLSSWIGFYLPVGATADLINVQVETGNVATPWKQSQEDLQSLIDSKANQALTQAQMLALEERSALARDNAIAEAMKNTISEVEAKWQTWYNLNTADEKQKVANDIASLFERVAKFEQNLGEASARFEFINNETLIGEEGVAIGDKGGKAKLFLSNDSISFVTNGVAQMTLTGDTLTIKNGLFTERIQIGNYVEEVYDRNPLYNVIRPIKYS